MGRSEAGNRARGEKGRTHHEFPKALLIALWIILVLIPVLVPSARASLCVSYHRMTIRFVVRGEEASRGSVL